MLKLTTPEQHQQVRIANALQEIQRQLTIANTIRLWELAKLEPTEQASSYRELLAGINAIPRE